MEKQISTWSREKDDQLHLLKDIWKNTDLAVQRKFLFDFIDSNFHLQHEQDKRQETLKFS